MRRLGEKERGFQADQLTELQEQFDITDVEYRVAQAQVADLTGSHYAELVALAEELGVDNLAVLHASNRKLAQAQLAADNARIIAAQETQDALTGIASGGDRSGLTPGGLGYDAVRGGKGRIGGLTAAEAAKRLENKGVGEWIEDPHSGHIWAKMREPFSGARASQWVSRFANPAALAVFIESIGGSLTPGVPAAQHGAVRIAAHWRYTGQCR